MLAALGIPCALAWHFWGRSREHAPTPTAWMGQNTPTAGRGHQAALLLLVPVPLPRLGHQHLSCGGTTELQACTTSWLPGPRGTKACAVRSHCVRSGSHEHATSNVRMKMGLTYLLSPFHRWLRYN